MLTRRTRPPLETLVCDGIYKVVGGSYTIDKIWKKSYLAKSLWGWLGWSFVASQHGSWQ